MIDQIRTLVDTPYIQAIGFAVCFAVLLVIAIYRAQSKQVGEVRCAPVYEFDMQPGDSVLLTKRADGGTDVLVTRGYSEVPLITVQTFISAKGTPDA